MTGIAVCFIRYGSRCFTCQALVHRSGDRRHEQGPDFAQRRWVGIHRLQQQLWCHAFNSNHGPCCVTGRSHSSSSVAARGPVCWVISDSLQSAATTLSSLLQWATGLSTMQLSLFTFSNCTEHDTKWKWNLLTYWFGIRTCFILQFTAENCSPLPAGSGSFYSLFSNVCHSLYESSFLRNNEAISVIILFFSLVLHSHGVKISKRKKRTPGMVIIRLWHYTDVLLQLSLNQVWDCICCI